MTMDRMTMNERMDGLMNDIARAAQPPPLDDSARNQLAELRHEPCFAHCESCGACIEETDAFSIADGTYDYFCEEC
jgi:hypothetical protein